MRAKRKKDRDPCGASAAEAGRRHLEHGLDVDNVVALDCEMVGVGPRKQSALARCSIVDFHGKVLYDKYVKPDEPVTDYRTRWSGVSPRHMAGAVPFKQARKEVVRILRNKVVVGHALHFDFKVLKLRRSSFLIRDTSRSVQLRQLAGIPVNRTPSLKLLASSVLNTEIQQGQHCSIEDSCTAMDLYRLVRDEWEGGDLSRKYLDDSFWPESLS